jgi:hypothetical protein
MKVALQMPYNEFNEAIADTLVDFFNRYQDNVIKRVKENELEENQEDAEMILRHETKTQKDLASAIQFHYLNSHNYLLKDINRKMFSRATRAIYTIIGIPKKYRNGCKKYFTPELRNAISHMQISLKNKLYDTNVKYDLSNYDVIESLIEADFEFVKGFVGDLVPACVKTLDKLSEAGIIKKTKSKQQKAKDKLKKERMKENVEIKTK